MRRYLVELIALCHQYVRLTRELEAELHVLQRKCSDLEHGIRVEP